MIPFETIQGYYPEQYRMNPLFRRYMLMEYLQLMILDYLSGTSWFRKLVFIGGTSLRLVRGIDRWSEGLDFDSKDFTSAEFEEMTAGVLAFLQRSGLGAEAKQERSAGLKAFRKRILFPGLLQEAGLTGHREERLMIKMEAQDQGVDYPAEIAYVKGCGFFIPVPVPPLGVLCSMKIVALLNRRKGRDFFDVMFLMAQTLPDLPFLRERCGIGGMEELKEAVAKVLQTTDMEHKQRDFEHLLFHREQSRRILTVGDLFRTL